MNTLTVVPISRRAIARAGSRPSRTPKVFQSSYLPSGWRSYFRPLGTRGLSITCPTCGFRPPQHLSGYQKWKVLSVHQAKHKTAHHFAEK